VLTPAEWGVVNGVRHGMTNRMIARARGISLDAVKFHVENAVGKLGLEGRDALRHWRGAPMDSALGKMETTVMANLQLGDVGQIARHVADIDRSEAWFRDVLGLRHLYSFPSPIGKLAFFDCGGTRLFLETAKDGRPSEQSLLYFRVPDINAAFDELKGRGIEFVDAPHMIAKLPDGTEEWMAFFKDCDGQLLSIMSQVKPG
jgi:catechol 2,3-dioxygenase-like lactoylglutathione lyase family enzyme/DNA-binding CsgD family transcriptional regulator